jgi:glutathione S-transferase
MIRLYYYPSYVSLFPHILLQELGLAYELVLVDRYADAHKREAYLATNPNGLIPVLVDGDLVLHESAAIALHLVDAHPAGGSAPACGTPERARFYQWLMWLATGLHPARSMVFHPGKWAGTDETQAELRVRAETGVAALFDLADRELARHGRPWLLGDAYSAVDAYALVLCRWSRRMARPGANWPCFGPYARRVLERPAVERALRAEHLEPPWI